jgi:phage-related protein
MTQASGAQQTVVQQLVQQLTAPLQEATKAFSTKIAESLTQNVGEITKAFKEAHPAIARVTDKVIGWSGAVSQATGSVSEMVANTTGMIRNTRELRQEITKVLDSTKVLDGVRLRFMQVGDAIKRSGTAALQTAANVARTATAKTLAAAKAVVLTIATKAWAVAQAAINRAMRLNPLGLIIAAITLLVAGIVLAYHRSTTFRNIVNAVFTAVKNVVVSAINVIRNIVAVVWPYIVKVIHLAVTVIRGYVTTYFTIIRAVITTVWNAIRTVITAVWREIVTVVRTYITIVRTVITTVFNTVRAVVSTVWNAIRGVINGAVSTVVNTILGINRVVGIVRDAFNQARSAVGNAVSGVIGFVRGLPGQVVGALGNIGRTLYDKGSDLISGFINGIRDMAGRIVGVIKDSILDKIPGPIKGFLRVSSPSRLMADIGVNIGEGLVVGIEASGEMVARAMTRLVPVPNPRAIRPAIANLATAAVDTVALPLATAGGVAGAQPVTVNVHPRAGQSEYEIGRIAAREVAWSAKH